MSLWAKAQQLPNDTLQQIRAIYGEHFPIEVRHFMAAWIEENMGSNIDTDNPQNEQFIAGLVGGLIQELEMKAASLNSEDMFLSKIKLLDAAKMFRQRYSTNPMNLYNYVKQCLTTEMKFVQGATNAFTQSSATAEMVQQMEILRQRTKESANELRLMEQEQEAFALNYHECTKLNAHLQHIATQPSTPQQKDIEVKLKLQKEKLEQALNQKVAHLLQARLALIDKLKETIEALNTLQSKVLDDELIRWKREQQLAGNGAAFNSNLDTIQEWCESLAEVIWSCRQQVREAERLRQRLTLEPPGVPDLLPALGARATQLLSTLVTSTFVIEKQPPQVMKTNTRFTSTVRLLVGGKLNVHMTPPQVKVTIISENQANALLKNEKIGGGTGGKSGEASGEILNNTGTMEYQQSTRQLSVSFRNMQLKKIKRAEKKGTESVMDEKFSLLFQSQFNVGGGELVFQVWTLSLPVVVIVHGNQEPHAWATVTWDNAFAAPGRVPFAVPDKVSWSLVAEALNIKFRSATGRSLTEDNLRFLGEKAFRSATSNPDMGQMLLTWAQFCKEPLADRNFTFWEWFYAVMKLTREHLRGPWVDGLVLGFIRKKQTEEMLSQCSNGTFLLRFSDSELGGVTIAWVGESGEVFMLQPFTSKDFAIRSLADRVSDLQHLVSLYPDIPKDSAFSKYYTPFQENPPTTNNGYVKPLLVTHVPGWSGPGGSYAGTPHHNASYMHSPDPARDSPSVHSSYYPGAATPMSTHAGSVASNWNMNNVGSGMGSEMDYSDIGQQLEGLDDYNLDIQTFSCFPDMAQNPIFNNIIPQPNGADSPQHQPKPN